MHPKKTIFRKESLGLDSKKLEQDLGYCFVNKDLLLEALSHPSLKQHISKNMLQKSYERLELLGDTIINFVITEILFNNFRLYDEGKLAKIRAYLVCKELLCKVATKINLPNYIIMTQGEEMLGGRKNPNNIENAMEALIAAIYLDSNIDKVKRIIHTLWNQFISPDNLENYDPKSTLQELAQKNGADKPVYELTNRNGSAHSSIFTVVVKVKNYQETGTGLSIKEAEKDAARKLMNILKFS